MAAALLPMIALGWLSWAGEAGGPGAWLGRAAGLTVLLAGAAFAEELVFRGYPLQALAEGLGGPVAIAATGVAFGLVHGANPGVTPLALVNITLAGILLGVAYWRTFSLWFATGVHLGWNWMMAVPADLEVSGLGLDMPAVEASLAGPPLWTGGEFGPEGGLLVTAVTVVGTAWLWRTPLLSRSLEVRALVPLADRERVVRERRAAARGLARIETGSGDT